MRAPCTQTSGATGTPSSRPRVSACHRTVARVRIQAIVVVPDQLVGALVDLPRPLLGVDHDHPAGANDQVVEVGGRVRHGQVMEDHIALAAQAAQQPGRLLFAFGAALPDPGLGGGAEPQPPADQGRHRQAGQPGPWQAGGAARAPVTRPAASTMGARQVRLWVQTASSAARRRR
jgi:hypothetical protein